MEAIGVVVAVERERGDASRKGMKKEQVDIDDEKVVGGGGRRRVLRRGKIR